MSIFTTILAQTATELGISFTAIDSTSSFLVLHFPKKDHFIINTKMGLIDSSEEYLGLDKSFQYQLLHQKISMPKTLSYIDPSSRYGQYAQLSSQKMIQEDILKNYSLPFILKKNQGSEGIHVYKVNSLDELEEKIQKIFNQNDKDYDYVLLAQEYIQPKKEYRVIVYNQQIQFAYEKDISKAEFSGNLSPLHWNQAKTILVQDPETVKKLDAFTLQIYSVWPIQYAGFDLIEDKDSNLWLIEVNTSPSFAMFIRDNGEEKVKELYSNILQDLQKKYS